MQAKHGKREVGYTLVELLVVVVVICVLTAIAITVYKKYSIRAHREDVKSGMIQIAQNLQTYKAANGSYTSADISNPLIFGGTQYPLRGVGYYTMGLTVANGGWVLTATTIDTTMQKNNGLIALNDDGQKCWNNPNGNTTNACVNSAPTVATTWDGK